MGGSCGTHGGDEKCKERLVVKTERERPLGRPRPRQGIILKWILKK
jgi:hypothetical protein